MALTVYSLGELSSELSLGDFEPTPILDAWLTALAWRAKSDPRARADLFGLLSHKIARFSGLQRRRLPYFQVTDFEDVSQESFIVFCSVLRSWPGAGNFCGYFFSSFPRRLSDAVLALEYGRYRNSQRFASLNELKVRAPWIWPGNGDDHDHDHDHWLVSLAEGLPDRARQVVILRVAYQMSFVDIARMMALDYRTIHRDWLRAVEQLRKQAGRRADRPERIAGARHHVTDRQ